MEENDKKDIIDIDVSETKEDEKKQEEKQEEKTTEPNQEEKKEEPSAKQNNDYSKEYKEGVEETKKFTSWMEGLPLVLKIVFALPFLDLVWGVYRLFKGMQSGDPVRIVVAILMIIPGSFLIWILDIVWIAMTGNGFWF